MDMVDATASWADDNVVVATYAIDVAAKVYVFCSSWLVFYWLVVVARRDPC